MKSWAKCFGANNLEKVVDDNDFYLVGEIYNYGISGGKYFDFGNNKVNYFDGKFTSQINFEFKWNFPISNSNLVVSGFTSEAFL